MTTKHICNPQATSTFNYETYQCGCGRYFPNDIALKQQEVWRRAQWDTGKESNMKWIFRIIFGTLVIFGLYALYWIYLLWQLGASH